MAKKNFLLNDVFGVRSNYILGSHIVRDAVDEKFKDSIEDDQRHIIIHGASKQGKTSLLQKHLDSERYVKIAASNQMNSRSDFYNSLLVTLGARVLTDVQTKKEVVAGGEVNARVSLKIPQMLEISTGGKGSLKGSKDIEYTEETFSVNLSIVQDVKSVLDKCFDKSKFIVVENFHYFQKDFQRQFAQDLRTWNDFGYRFIVLGIWTEQNYLKGFNDELNDRVFEIPVEPWHYKDLLSIERAGGELMNTSIAAGLLDKVMFASFGSVAVFQDLIKKMHEISEIKETCSNVTEISDEAVLRKAIEIKSQEYRDGYLNHLRDLSGMNVVKGNALYLLFYLVKYFFKNDIPSAGVTRDNLLSFFEKEIKHRRVERKVLSPAVYQMLNSLRNTLDNLNWTNKIYFVGDRLYILDPLLRFYLKYTNREADLATIPEPWV